MRLLTIPEAAERLGVKRTTVYALFDSGDLERVRIGRRALVVEDSIDDYIRRLVSAGRSKGTTATTPEADHVHQAHPST